MIASLAQTEQCWLVLDAHGVIHHRNPPASLLLGTALMPGQALPPLAPCALLGEGSSLLDLAQLALDELTLGVQLQPPQAGWQLCRLVDLTPALQQEHERRQRECYLSVLSELSSLPEKNRVRRLELALSHAAEALGLQAGLVTRYCGDALEVVAHCAPQPFSHGTLLPLELMYCEHTLRSNSLLAVHDILDSVLADSACYRQTGIRSYIGIPLEVDGQRYGTLAFWGLPPHAPFTEADAQFVRHLARWVGIGLERKLAADELSLSYRILEEQLDWLRLAGQVARLGHWSYSPRSGWVTLSAEACALLALPRQHLPLSEVERRMVVEDRQRWRKAFTGCLYESGELQQEVRLRQQDDRVSWLSLRAQLVERGDGPLLFGVLMDVTEAKESQQLILYQASHDGLTGCVNRVLLFDRLEQEIRRCERLQQSFSLMFIDLDRFKLVNDHHGHDAGDKVLMAIANRLQRMLRTTDTVARVGGDEFVLLLPGMAPGRGLAMLQQEVLAQIERPVRDGRHSYRVSASMGVASYPQDGGDAGALLKFADGRMYQEKRPARH
ncbi:sensor domain-containing diguanylate cyclase [Vogesella sp. LIG4]|uniref:sensor domain-containing diguanylate cyclase n=1 Tax=Vogesella sp. LIG4 TaxID=1192162 RepID=UPI0012FD22FB|nr:sensor domain-containing diguanylate cyclase [Vogesella sp. LIG4]